MGSVVFMLGQKLDDEYRGKKSLEDFDIWDNV